MADPTDFKVPWITAHRKLSTYVIEHPFSRQHSLLCDLNGVLALRVLGRSGHERPAAERPNYSHQV